jgi:hypothetical protein
LRGWRYALCLEVSAVSPALRLRIGLLLGLIALSAGPAVAQGPWQSLFGYSTSPRHYSYPGFSPYSLRSPFSGPFSPYRPRGEDDFEPAPRGIVYRTMCVRLCDGYYFPISSVVTRDGLGRDAEACSARCGAEARLFYHPGSSSDVADMVDLTGMAYSALPNAFRYRKALVEGCQCRPQPWSEAERARHRGYAEGQAQAAGPPRDAKVIAGGGSRLESYPPGPDIDQAPRSGGAGEAPSAPPSTDDSLLVARPQPITRQIEVSPAWLFPAPVRPGIPRSRYAWPDRQQEQ